MNFYKSDTVTVTEKTWEEYAKTKEIALRNQILSEYLYIVSCNIRKMSIAVSSREDIEDLTNQGVLELINCINRYDYTRGVQFDTYASIRVRGSIIDFIRKNDWVPQNVRKRIRDVSDATLQLQNQLGRAPDDEEIKNKLNIDEEELEKIRKDEVSVNVMALEELLQSNSPVTADVGIQSDFYQPDEKILLEEYKTMLVKCIDELDENERNVVSLYYYEGLKLKEIAFVMGLTPSRISQIHSKALDKIKNGMNKYING